MVAEKTDSEMVTGTEGEWQVAYKPANINEGDGNEDWIPERNWLV